jgi:alcohol dehydrogenase class IV
MAHLGLTFPSRLLYGEETFHQLGTITKSLGNRALIVTETAMHVETYLEQAQQFLHAKGVSTIVFEEIPPTVTTLQVREAARIIKASKPQTIISLGGMRVISAARAATAQGRAQISDGVTKPVCIEIPTSCRNHGLFRNEWVITDAETSSSIIQSFSGDMIHTILVDPTLSYSLSSRYFAVAMLDTLLASVEGYMSDGSNFLSDTYLDRAILLLGEALSIHLRNPEDLQARNKAVEAGLLSAMGLAASSQGIGSALSFVINSKKKVPKSWVASVLLPHVLELYAKDHPIKLRRIAQSLGEDVEGIHPEVLVQKAPAATRRLLGALELPGRLRDLNLSLSDLGEVSALAVQLPYSKTLPFRMNDEAVYELVKKAF